eukprot:CAMPEP_0172877068 /NCGR_PEP_ID=MMETSP1075-20121228/106041_2 /TAXON_ID=2916 /ORGANISM="Ceratium fusus, Strain PA161109" /LENGTH=314 /DNA_ID=CAMNT_0013728547 /DNA_START=21 /DNA_END=961 /DNA_ORIENTATION=-
MASVERSAYPELPVKRLNLNDTLFGCIPERSARRDSLFDHGSCDRSESSAGANGHMNLTDTSFGSSEGSDSPTDHADFRHLGSSAQVDGHWKCCFATATEAAKVFCNRSCHDSALRCSCRRRVVAASSGRLAPVSQAVAAMSAVVPVVAASQQQKKWPNNATTAMIRNIPNRYTAEEMLAELLSTGFKGTFDFFYLPMDFVTKKNKGYGFVNFRSSETAVRFIGIFHGLRLPRYATEKALEVVPAVQQGYEANIAAACPKGSTCAKSVVPANDIWADGSCEAPGGRKTVRKSVAYRVPGQQQLDSLQDFRKLLP